ncbi:DUF488 domain-containing protein [Novosphingobium sp. BL-8H]|uniref:DUF488 domain-containing protein n=1 Tax=Novosphingobium sp. BL-8H TaxID=3127640 RepID=UPI0037563A7E
MPGLLHIKRVYDPPSQDDGARILVDRIWPRGLRRDEAQLTTWMKDLAPTTALRKWFAHDPARFDEFKVRYHDELDRNGDGIAKLEAFIKEGSVTLLYGAKDAAHNNAVVLAEYIEGKLSR